MTSGPSPHTRFLSRISRDASARIELVIGQLEGAVIGAGPPRDRL